MRVSLALLSVAATPSEQTSQASPSHPACGCSIVKYPSLNFEKNKHLRIYVQPCLWGMHPQKESFTPNPRDKNSLFYICSLHGMCAFHPVSLSIRVLISSRILINHSHSRQDHSLTSVCRNESVCGGGGEKRSLSHSSLTSYRTECFLTSNSSQAGHRSPLAGNTTETLKASESPHSSAPSSITKWQRR